jgi:FtsP/CotA-like multicopper oxidase with cupredoxin domain
MFRLSRLLFIGLLTVAAAVATTQAASAGPPGPTLPPTAQNIAVPAGNKVFLVGHATGVQIYTCVGGTWSTASTPRAVLVGDNGQFLADHFGGPTWQAKDGSKVVGTVSQRATVDPTAIPWLLLTATASAGPDGDRLAATTYVQRVNTTGGLRPTSTCDPAVDKPAEVRYTADYYFWKKTGGGA